MQTGAAAFFLVRRAAAADPAISPLMTTLSAYMSGAAARKLAPESELGAFLNLDYGVPVAMGISVGVFGVLAGILARLGHPIANWKGDRDA